MIIDMLIIFNADFHFFSSLDGKCPFRVNLAEKLKSVNLSLNLVPRIF